MTRSPGRPSLPPDERKSKVLYVLLTPAMHAALSAIAKRNSRSLSAEVLDRLLSTLMDADQPKPGRLKRIEDRLDKIEAQLARPRANTGRGKRLTRQNRRTQDEHRQVLTGET